MSNGSPSVRQDSLLALLPLYIDEVGKLNHNKTRTIQKPDHNTPSIISSLRAFIDPTFKLFHSFVLPRRRKEITMNTDSLQEVGLRERNFRERDSGNEAQGMGLLGMRLRKSGSGNGTQGPELSWLRLARSSK